MEKQLTLKGIGTVNFKKNDRAKYIRISISPTSGIRVTIPKSGTLNDALSFVEKKQAWIKKSVEKLNHNSPIKTVFNNSTGFKTYYHELVLLKHDSKNIKIKLEKGKINIFYPFNKKVEDEFVQEGIRHGIILALKNEARFYLPKRVEQLASKFNLNYKQVKVKDTKTRWGSCSSTNNINLNIHLMRLPSHLIDYVILHELAHTIHKNHGKNFWHFLDTLTNGKSREYAYEIKQYNTRIF
ncbi:MAG: M48 family metallopeptidase [Bacteroidota bacterium]